MVRKLPSKAQLREYQRLVYPSMTDMMTLLGVFLVATVLSALMVNLLTNMFHFSTGFSTFWGYLVQFGVTILFGLYQRFRKIPKGFPLLRFSLKRTNFTLILWGLILVMAMGVVIEPILLIFPSEYLIQLGNIMGHGGWMMVTSILLAPLLEEVLFRGVLQEALTAKYGGWRGILVASALFGIVHIIPQQVVNAFFVGLILGYIYYRTRSLVSVVAIHCLNNAVSYFSWLMSGEKITMTREQIANDTLYYIVYAIAFVVLVVSLVFILRGFSKQEQFEREEQDRLLAAHADENGYPSTDSATDSASANEMGGEKR